MKRFIVAAAALASLGLLQTAAHAQPYGPYNPPYQQPYNPHPDRDYERHYGEEDNQWDLDQRIRWLEDRIERGQESGEIDRYAAYRARQQIEGVRHDEDRYRARQHGRLTESERERLIDRIEAISRELHWREDYREPWQYR